jgi:outer membrane lipoprotein LolB
MRKKTSSPLLANVLLSLSFLLLASCQIMPGITYDTAAPAGVPEKCRENIEFAGRVSVNYTLSQNDRTESLHGKFTWKQYDRKTRIHLYSPLGQTLAIIDVLPEVAVFTASGKTPVSATSVDELVFRQLGWPLPVSGMKDWLQGCATNAEGQPIQTTPAHPDVITQDGWHIHYIDWNTSAENRAIPKRIDMSHTPSADAAISDIRIRLIIDERHDKMPPL